MQCGLACLQMICDFFGTNYSLETISRYCFATTEGTSLRSINEAALKLGFHTIVGKVTIPQLKEASPVRAACLLRIEKPAVKKHGFSEEYTAQCGKSASRSLFPACF